LSSEDHVSPLSFFWRNKRERMMEQKNKRRRKKAEKTLQKKVKKNDKKRTTLFPMLERVCMFSVGSPPPSSRILRRGGFSASNAFMNMACMMGV